MNYVILVYEIEFFISSKYKYGIMAYGGGSVGSGGGCRAKPGYTAIIDEIWF